MRVGFINPKAPAGLAFLMVIVLALTGPLMEMTDVLPESVKAARQVGYLVAFAISLLSLVPFRPAQLTKIIPWPMVALLLWCWLSLTWSSMPATAVRRLGLTTAVAGTIMVSISRLGYRNALALVRWPMAIMLLLSLGAIFALPDTGLQEGQGLTLWRGLLADKNIAGTFCALTIILFNADAKSIPQVLRWGVIALAAAFLIMTHSRTAWIAGAVAVALSEGITRYHTQIAAWAEGQGRPVLRMVGWAVVAVVCAGLILLTLDRDILLSMTADENMISKRGAIWRPMVQAYVEHPLIGTGYGSFWQNDAMDAGAFGGNGWLHNVDQGHNGYLDLAVQTGLPGLLLALLTFALWPIRMLVDQMEKKPVRVALVSAVLAYCLINNFTESSMLMRDTLGNIFILLSLAWSAQIRSTSSDKKPPKKRRKRKHSDQKPIDAGSGRINDLC